MSALKLIQVKNPFDRRQRTVETLDYHYKSLEGIYEQYVPQGIDVVLSINGLPIERQFWATTRPRVGDEIVVMPVLGDLDDDVFRAVMMIAIAVAAPGIGGKLAGTFGFAGKTAALMFTAGVAMAGGLLVNSLMPTPQPKSPFASDWSESQIYGWSPHTTQKQGLVVPRFYGKNKLYGNVIAVHTEVDDDDDTKQNLEMLISLGSGPVEGIVADTIKINGQEAGNFENVVTEEKRGLLDQTAVSFFGETKPEYRPMLVVENGTPRTYTTPDSDYDDLEIELLWDRGIYYANDQGGLSNHSVGIQIEISEADADSWDTLVAETVTDNTTGTKRKTYLASGSYTGGSAVSITNGKAYDIRVTKTSSDETSARYGDQLMLGAVREVLNDDFQYPLSALLGVQALATGQLSGSLSVSCIQEGRVVRVYNGATWSIEYSDNPAWVVWDILTEPVISGDGDGTAYAVERYDGVDPSFLDLAKFYEWADFCDDMVSDGKGSTEKRIRFNGGFDIATNRWEAALKVCEIGRAIIIVTGSKYTLAIDKAASAGQTYTIGNILKSSFKQTFLPLDERASEIDVQYRDELQDFERVPFTVYDSGIATSNRVSLELFGITSQSEVYRAGMYRLAQNRLLKSTVEFDVDIDAIVASVGDVINVQHDIPVWGKGGLIVSGTPSSVVVDQDLTYESGESYRLLLTRCDDTPEDKTVLTIYSDITGVNTGSKQFAIAGDLTDAYKSGDRIQVADSTGNDGTYTLASNSTHATGTTTITVSETIPDATVDGGLYNLRRVAVTVDFGALSHTITGVDQTLKRFEVSGDASVLYTDGNTITVLGSTGNDDSYTINGDASHDGTTTYITVDEAIPSAVADGALYNADYAAPTADDVYSFGITTLPAKKYRVMAIDTHGADFTATITAIIYDATLYDCDDAVPIIPIADYTSPQSAMVVHDPTWEEIRSQYPPDVVMALLTADIPLSTNLKWTSNSPSAGYVAWSADDGVNPILVSYRGTVYEITASNSNKKYIYWDKTSTTSFQASDNLADALGNGKWTMCINDSGTAKACWGIPILHAGILQADTLSAISAALGTITSGSITLSLGGDTRLRIDSSGLYTSDDAGSNWDEVIKNDGGTVKMFADILKAGEITTTKLNDLSATTPKIANDATTIQAVGGPGSGVIGTSWGTEATVNITTTGGTVQVIGSGVVWNTGTQSDHVYCRIKLGATVLAEARLHIPNLSLKYNYTLIGYNVPSAAQHALDIDFYKENAIAGSVINCEKVWIAGTEFLK